MNKEIAKQDQGLKNIPPQQVPGVGSTYQESVCIWIMIRTILSCVHQNLLIALILYICIKKKHNRNYGDIHINLIVKQI